MNPLSTRIIETARLMSRRHSHYPTDEQAAKSDHAVKELHVHVDKSLVSFLD